MSTHGKSLIEKVHGVPGDKIDLIPTDPVGATAALSKGQLGVQGDG